MKKGKTKTKYVPEFDPKAGKAKIGGIVFPINLRVKTDGTLESKKEATERTNYEADRVTLIDPFEHDEKFRNELLEWAKTMAKSEDEIEAEFLQLLRTDESGVSDDEFFEYIKERPTLLAATFAQQKIARWRNAIRENTDNDWTARGNLQKIGNALAFFKGHDRPRQNYADIYAWRQQCYIRIKEQRILDLRNETTRKDTLIKIFGEEIIDAINNFPSTYSKLADCITAQNFGLTPNTVKKYCKKVEQIDFGTDLLAFRPKNSK
jgi:hypothetical protein